MTRETEVLLKAYKVYCEIICEDDTLHGKNLDTEKKITEYVNKKSENSFDTWLLVKPIDVIYNCLTNNCDYLYSAVNNEAVRNKKRYLKSIVSKMLSSKAEVKKEHSVSLHKTQDEIISERIEHPHKAKTKRCIADIMSEHYTDGGETDG